MKKVTITVDDKFDFNLRYIQSRLPGYSASAIVRQAVQLYIEKLCSPPVSGAGAAPQICGKAQDAP